jgi:hypothetical protein
VPEASPRFVRAPTLPAQRVHVVQSGGSLAARTSGSAATSGYGSTTDVMHVAIVAGGPVVGAVGVILILALGRVAVHGVQSLF